jgi:hypothetical protein
MAKLTGQTPLVEAFEHLGYPIFLFKILGVAYFIGVAAILQPKFNSLRQWGYSGFSIALVRAIASHLLEGDPVRAAVPAIALLTILGSVVIMESKLRDQ